jgi:SAM-dependent methyltransferase
VSLWFKKGTYDMLDATLEADFIESLQPRPRSVLDAGCGTGRVAIELARRGIDVVGVDISTAMLAKARRAAPHLAWRLGDIARVRLERRFDAVVMPGNVMIFLARGTEAAVLRNMALHLAPGGRLVTGFYLGMGRLHLDEYDRLAVQAGLHLATRYAGWRREPWHGGSEYVMSVHTVPGSKFLVPGSI